MSIDVNSIHNIATAIADREREEHNKGKGTRSRDYETKEQARKKAAQLTIEISMEGLVCYWQIKQENIWGTHWKDC